MPPPTPTLPDELLEEIFLRLPPDEPACLVRASLASKLWLGLLTGPAFRGRYRDLHGAPPMLGFLYTSSTSFWDSDQEEDAITRFVSPTKFAARIPDKPERGKRKYESLDCRHGRVLLADKPVGFRELAVWDPMTGRRRDLGTPLKSFALGAAVLCAVTGCDHRACHQGPFRVLLFGMRLDDGQHSTHAWVCSSEAEEWSELCSPLQLGLRALIRPWRSVLFGNALYHTIQKHDGDGPDHIAILKYDMGSNCMSLLDGPPGLVIGSSAILMAMDDESLGFTYLDCFTLYRWSRQILSDGVKTWTQRRVVDLKELLPINPKTNFRLIGFKEGSGIVFVTTDLGIYEINLKSLEWKKLWKRENNIHALIPYMTFYNPPERVTSL